MTRFTEDALRALKIHDKTPEDILWVGCKDIFDEQGELKGFKYEWRYRDANNAREN